MQKIAGGASEDQETGGEAGAVGEDAEEGEEVGAALDLIDDHQATEIAEGELGLLQARQVVGVFGVEAGGRAGSPRHEHLRQGRLPHLPCTEDGDYRVVFQEALQPAQKAFTRDHEAVYLEKRTVAKRFSR